MTAARLTSVKAEQLPLLNSVSAPAAHPDGTRAVVSVTRPDFDADAYVGQLWSVPFDPAIPPRRITRGFRDTAPAFSPDGRALAFLRATPDGKPQLHVVEADGGEPQAITEQKLGVSEFSWAPDARRIVFSSRVPEEGRYGTVDGVGAGSEDARLITDNQYRLNGLGYTADKPAQLFVVDVPELGAEPAVVPVGRAAKARGAEAAAQLPPAVQLTFGEADHTSPSFSRNGESVYFVASLHEGHDADIASGIYSVPAAGGEATALRPGAAPQSVQEACESANGEWLFFTAQDLGDDGLDFVARNTALYVMPVRGGKATMLSDVENQDIGGRLEAFGIDGVLALNTSRGSVQLIQWTADGESEVLVKEPLVVIGASAVGELVSVSYGDAFRNGELGVLEKGGLRVLTDFTKALRDETTVFEPHEFTATGRDGYPVHGWAVLPEGPGPHPVLLTIHGGPFAQYTGAFFDEAQVYAEAGYAVLMCNPRGSAGYGQAHGGAIKEKMGTVDMSDVLTFLEGALEAFPAMDRESIGIMGGSYGGYLTAWVIGHEHRFKAAIVERGFLDPVSFTGSSDIGWFFGGQYTGGSPEQMAAQSPMAVVTAVRTPTLVIHSENDLRCPVEQGQRYFAALKAQGVETALLLFPGEDHELSRSGTPHHRRQRFGQILAWWAKHLPSAVNPPREDGSATA
ncbi:S9 family peptidase [Arthrobacter gyeryongensis]|uniref:S9 family peptidase n=1 Tax=Arthrobacter gyeryongensis TaxID=1650592 RepID=A0ABP9SJ56_9MICC